MIAEAIARYNERHGFGSGFTPKAVLFDMDGVLYNSMPHHAIAWHRSMAEYGIEMSEEEAYMYEGMRGVETIRLMVKAQQGRDITMETAQMMYDRKSAIFSSLGEAKKMEGVEDLMRQIKSCGLKICVVTGSGQHTLIDHLEEEFAGLIHRDLMVTSYDVKRGKPQPDPYLMGLEKCGVKPWEAVVVENAPLGVRAGVAAEIFTVAVNTGPLPDKILADEGADLVFRRMTDFRDAWMKWTSSLTPDPSPEGEGSRSTRHSATSDQSDLSDPSDKIL